MTHHLITPDQGHSHRVEQWVEKIVRLIDLRPFESNPRSITEAQFAKLKQSILESGYHSRIKCTHDLRVIGGHQRIRALMELGVEEVPVHVPPRPLSDEEFLRVMIIDNHSNGVWDMDALANSFDLEMLHDVGLHEVNKIREPSWEPGKKMVKCPECQHAFPIKGNAYNGEQ